MKNTTETTPLSYIQESQEWSQFYTELWGHELFGFICLGFIIGLIASVLDYHQRTPKIDMVLALAASLAFTAWMFTG